MLDAQFDKLSESARQPKKEKGNNTNKHNNTTINTTMEFEMPKDQPSIIKVIGVGGGGSNAVNHMYNEGIKGVDFVVCNTDLQSLQISPVPYKIQLGPSLTEGRGAGSLPEIGKNAAIENIEEIRAYLSKDTKMVFVTAGMGGGTGTGAAPVIAQIAKEMGILTVGIVTVPFNFEGRKRKIQAEEGLEQMRQNVDTLLVINNERLREITGNLSISDAFTQADNILATAARGIAEVIAVTGGINVDFNDVNTVMKDSGVAIMGSAVMEGVDRAVRAVEMALESPLLNDNDISGAEYVLLNITYGEKEVSMDEISAITDYIQDAAGSTADVIFGHAKDDTLGEKLSVTVIATGFKSTPVTGFEKMPEVSKTTLMDEVKNEITTPLESPTHQNTTWANAKEVSFEAPKQVDEPVFETKIVDEPVMEIKEISFEEPQKAMEFDWSSSQVNNVANNSTPSIDEPVTRFTLEEESEIRLELDTNVTAKREVLSPEEQQRRSQERLSRIHEYTMKLKKVENINEYEKEPAYVRRNVQLDDSIPSRDDNQSRFSISKNDGNISLNTNNSFLHDNVD